MLLFDPNHLLYEPNHIILGWGGWGTLALVTAGIAQGKNRSGLTWFFLALFLGPIALFVLVVFFS
ncbi:MAG: hypothetical protein HQK54_11265 [Oligoflexales bacterium]|nr:hypothetical protein [Oligoflexales bacterium]